MSVIMSSSTVYSMETEDPITVNKARTSRSWMHFSTDYVRCFCNLPQCVSTGYMCKSSGGVCFSSFNDPVDPHSRDYTGRHGCIELLRDKQLRSLCMHDSPTDHNKSPIFCCRHDMCNHVDNSQTKNLINNNNTLLGPHLEKSETSSFNTIANLQQPIDYSNSQVWFRAATIAVPVCGAMILFVLIALAVRILRSENRNNTGRKLGVTMYETSRINKREDQPHTFHNIVKNKLPPHQFHNEDLQRVEAPLLMSKKDTTSMNQFLDNKNDTNAKLNLIQCEQSVILDIEKSSINKCCPEINLVKNVICEEKFVNVKRMAPHQ